MTGGDRPNRHLVETPGRGECFGAIALLRDCVRSATVCASENAELRVSVLPARPSWRR
jgi:CRP-like cAMP-binding protein